MVIKHRKSITAAFIITAVIGFVLSLTVSVNYNMADYLPQDAASTSAIGIMQVEFDGAMPNARVMINNITLQDAILFKEELAVVKGIISVTWLDDIIGPDILKTVPLEFLDSTQTENYYNGTSALYYIAVESGLEKPVIQSIYDLIGENNAAEGDAVNTAMMQTMSSSEVIKAMAILVPVIILILILASSSWFEPLLYLVTIGVAVLINMGTNFIFGEISFITQAVSPILQLAVSLDYAIFLLHTFNDLRSSHEPEEAMAIAVKRSFSSVAASAGTTVIGFFALVFMRFGIGADLGLNLVKGILLSFITVTVFLPAFTLTCYKFIDKTKHRSFIPGLKGSGTFLLKIRIPFLILAAVIVLPCFLAQSKTEFVYGSSVTKSDQRTARDSEMIENRFGKENVLVLLVPKGETGKESELCASLSDIPHITGVMSYVTAVSAVIPAKYVPENAYKQFYSENYARIILYTDNPEESSETFLTVQTVLDTAEKYYKTYYLTGQSAALYDMKNAVAADTSLVNLIAVIGIFIVLLVTFRSLTVPLILLFTIETAIWINLSLPYFTSQSLNYLGFLVISTVQLGATVDYAILMTNSYFAARKEHPKHQAMKTAVGDNLIAVIISAAILSTAGFTLAFSSANPIISELGLLLGRGTILSFVMVACVLPALLLLFDKAIQKTSLRCRFSDKKEYN